MGKGERGGRWRERERESEKERERQGERPMREEDKAEISQAPRSPALRT